MRLNIGGPSRAVFVIKSFDKCRKFYEGFLGLPIDSEWNRGPGDRGVVYEVGTTHLELLEGDHDQTDDGVYLYIPVEDVDAVWAWLASAAEVVVPIATHIWGHRNFMIRDPAGVKLKFYSPVANRLERIR